MLDRLKQPTEAAPTDVARYVCREDDSLWTGIERALDNGLGLVFVTDAAGVVSGRATLDGMRSAVRNGAHTGFPTMAAVAVACGPSDDKAAAVAPILDGNGRLVGVRSRPEASFLPVAEPDLTHAEFRNLIDAYLSTWISSTGDYVRAFEREFAEKVGMAYGVTWPSLRSVSAKATR
jgi:perosamine synthetase